jgi:hypothetical protein
MESNSEQWVPKVHPATRAVEPEDPMTLHANAVPGDPEEMLRCLVLEYAWMGWDADRIMSLFRDPFYPALHSLWCAFGEAGIRQRLFSALRQCPVLNIDEAVVEESEAPGPEPELIDLGIRNYPQMVAQGEHHAKGL